MGDGRQVGVRPEIVKKILAALEDAKVEIDRATVDALPAGALGGSPQAAALFGDLHHATSKLQASLSAQSQSLIKFGQAIEDAQKAIENADEDSSSYASVIQAAVDGVTRQFHEATGTDNRPTAPVGALAALGLGGLGSTLQQLESQAEFEQGVSK